MTLNEAAARLKTSERTIRRRIAEGHIKANKDNGKWIIEDLGAFDLVKIHDNNTDIKISIEVE